jgi:eukaryotic-like serine/threonine-protein kinase
VRVRRGSSTAGALRRGEFLAPLSRLQALELDLTDGHADEAERRKSDGRGHASDLAIAPLVHDELDPPIGNGLAHADRWIARRQGRRGREDARFGGPRHVVPDLDAVSKGLEIGIARHPLDLSPVRLGVLEPGIAQPVLQRPVVGEEQQPLAVGIESPRRTDPRRQAEIGQRTPASLGRELAQHAPRLVEGDQHRHESTGLYRPDEVACSQAMTSSGADETEIALSRDRAEGDTGGGGELARGESVDRYVILSKLGAGGMGIVYAAYDPDLDRKVALKLVRPDLAPGTGGRARLLREAQSLAKLSHPNVVTVHDVGTHEREVWLAMEFVDGITLSDWLRERRPAWKEVLPVFEAIARGLAAAHVSGLVHRDVKPGNVMIDRQQRVRVMDFGLAHGSRERDRRVPSVGDEFDTDASETGDASWVADDLARSRTAVGTPAYMAPEQILGRETSARTDQFSFCVMLWEALYAERPFAGETPHELAANVVGGRLRSRSRRDRRVPSWLDRIVRRGLLIHPDQRWPSMQALLEGIVRGQRTATLRRASFVLVATASIGAGTLGMRQFERQEQIRECQRAGESIDALWNVTAKQEVRDGLLATGAPHAEATMHTTLSWLDQYAEEWKNARIDTCVDVHVTGEWDADLGDRAVWCLDDRRLELEALLHELSRIDLEVATRAVEAVTSISLLAPCRDEPTLGRTVPPPIDEREGTTLEIRIDLMRAKAQRAAGAYAAALDTAQRTHEHARASGHPSLEVAAGLELGQALAALSRHTDAAVVLEETYFAALPVGANDVALVAAQNLALVVGNRLQRYEDGIRWANHADALRLSVPDLTSIHEARGLIFRAAVFRAKGELEKARELYEEALTIRRRTLGPRHPEVAATAADLGLVLFDLGHWRQALGLYEEALEIRESIVGRDHILVANTLVRRGSALLRLKDLVRAEEAYRRALSILEANLPADHLSIADLLNNLGLLHRQKREYRTALALHERHLEIVRRTFGDRHPRVADAYNNLGAVYVDLDEVDRARELLERALDIKEEVHGPEHHFLAITLYKLAKLALSDGRFGDAVAYAERCAAVSDTTELPAGGLAEARFLVAQSLVAAGADRERAVALARQARDLFREQGSNSDLDSVTNWLTEHGIAD